MSVKYLLDENVDILYRTQLRRRDLELIVWVVGEPGAPFKGTTDPDLLGWCEEHGFVLVTNNRKTMPGHLAAHLAEERHIPGILVFDKERSTAETLDELLLIARASLAEEYQDRLIYLPLT